MPNRLVKFLVSIVGLMIVTIIVDLVGATPASPGSVGMSNGSIGMPDRATQASPLQTSSTIETNAFVVRAVDGDTLIAKFDGEVKEENIRLLGINTPETVDPRRKVECFGKEASARMHLLTYGKRVRLDEDVLADNVDKYGRLLRNVILEDGTDVNAAMVRDGYAYSYLSFPLDPRRKAELKNLENNARMAQRGLWSTSTCNGLK